MSNKKNGFTLVELVVVLAVVAIISSLAVSFATGTHTMRAANQDKIAVAEMNTIFTKEWGTESYAHPQTAADIRLVLEKNGFEWNEPRKKNSEYWFDTTNGTIVLGKMNEDALVLDDGTSVELKNNEKIIAPDGFLSGYVYMGTKFREYLDEFISIDVSDPAEAASKLNEIFSRKSVPDFLRRSLFTLAEHAIFIGQTKALSFVRSDEGDTMRLEPLQSATDMQTIAIFTCNNIMIDDQLKNSYIKSLYIPSDVTVEFNKHSFDDTWIQRVLINDDVEYGKLLNHVSKYEDEEFTMGISVLRKYYPSELPEYDLETYSVREYLELYDSKKASSNSFAYYYNNELRNKDDIGALYGGFYKLRPSDRRYVIKVRDNLYEHITTLNENLNELKELYALAKKSKPSDTELLVKGLTGSPEKYNLFWLSDLSSSNKNWSVLDNFDKLFDDFSTDNAVLCSNQEHTFTAERKGEGRVTLVGALLNENGEKDVMTFDFAVRGAYENISISGVRVGASKPLTVDGDKLGGEYYGTYNVDGTGEVIAPQFTYGGNDIHSKERIVVTSCQSDAAVPYNDKAIKLTKLNGDIRIKVKVASYLDPSVFSIYEVPLKGDAANIFSSNDFASAKRDRGLCFHSDVTYSGQDTFKVNRGYTVYGNGYTFTNTIKTAETMSKAIQMGEFRFPAVVTVEGKVTSLKIVARKAGQLGISNRFEAIAYTEDGDTRSTLGAAGLVEVIEGRISSDTWSGKKMSAFGKVKESYGPITVVSKRLAAVRVFGSGTMSNCFVEGGQYGVHIVGYSSDLGDRNNLDNVWIKDSLSANIYVSDNDGAKQNIGIKDVHTYNESSMAVAFPLFIEPKIVAVSTKKEGYTAVWGYGMCLKYYYGLLEGLKIKVNNLLVHNSITADGFYNMLRDNTLQNLQKITDYVRSTDKPIDYFKNDLKDIVDRLGIKGAVNVPIYYGEQCFIQIYDQHYSFPDTGNRSAAWSKNGVNERNGFADLISGYNSSSRASLGVHAGGTNEVALSSYIVNTNHGGNWTDPIIRP